MKGLIPLEEFIDGHREQYYEALEPTRNVASFVEFFLNGLIVQSEIVLKNFSKQSFLQRTRCCPSLGNS